MPMEGGVAIPLNKNNSDNSLDKVFLSKNEQVSINNNKKFQN
jgi:hypothetical protein